MAQTIVTRIKHHSGKILVILISITFVACSTSIKKAELESANPRLYFYRDSIWATTQPIRIFINDLYFKSIYGRGCEVLNIDLEPTKIFLSAGVQKAITIRPKDKSNTTLIIITLPPESSVNAPLVFNTEVIENPESLPNRCPDE